MWPEKNYGFLLDATGRQFFFHASSFIPNADFYDKAAPGMPVLFEEEPSDGRGPRAQRVQLLPSRNV